MNNIVKKFYDRFDRFLEHSSSGDIRLKAKIVAFLTGILILAVLLGTLAFINIEIKIPVAGNKKAYELLF